MTSAAGPLVKRLKMIAAFVQREILDMKKIVIKTVMVIVLVLHFLILAESVLKAIQGMIIIATKIVMVIVLVLHF